MARIETFTFRVSSEERRAIADLAARLKRSQSDAVRFVVVTAARELTQTDPTFVALPDEDSRQIEGDVLGVSKGGTYVTN